MFAGIIRHGTLVTVTALIVAILGNQLAGCDAPGH